MSNFFKKQIFLSTIVFAVFCNAAGTELIPEDDLKIIEGKKTPLSSFEKDILSEGISAEKDEEGYVGAIDPTKFEKVKLIDVVYEALSTSDILKSSREKVVQLDLKFQDSLAAFAPTMNLEYNYGRTQKNPSGQEGYEYKYFDDRNYRFVINQSLYSGGSSTYDVQNAYKKLEVGKNQYRIVLEEEIKKAIRSYFGVVFSYRSVLVNERNMKKLKRILQIVTVKYENGAATIGDMTSIKASVANATTKLVRVKSKFVEALRFYEYISGAQFENTLPYERNFDIEIENFDDVYTRALENNKGLINYYKTIEAEAYRMKSAQAAFKPKVDFEFSYKKTFEQEDDKEKKDAINGKFKVTYNLYNGGKDKNKILEVNSAIRDLKYRLSEEIRKLKWNLSKLFTSVDSVSQALDSTITEIVASRKAVSSYWEAFKLGEQDLQTLLQGQKQLNSAETELVKFEEDYITDFFSILELTGDLSSFFDVDPDNPKFIDFSRSDYKKTIDPSIVKELGIDLKTGKEIKKDKKADLVEKEDELEIKDPALAEFASSLDENINKYLEKFMNFDDDSFMIEISKFDNVYDSFNFLKEKEIDKDSIAYDVIDNYELETRIAHNNFETIEDAQMYLDNLESKDTNKKYEIKKVSDIKSSYNKYIDGLKIEKPKVETKIKIVEKIYQPVKKDIFITNAEFKKKFLEADASKFTINVSSFTKIEDVEKLINENQIFDNTLFYYYGDNGQLIKVVYGLFDNYKLAEQSLSLLSFSETTIFPVVEKVAFVQESYKNNIDFNEKKEEPIEYEYIDMTTNKVTKKTIKKEIKDIELEDKTKNIKLDSDDNISNLEKLLDIENPEKIEKIEKTEKSDIKENLIEVDTKSDDITIDVVDNGNISFVDKFLSSPKEYFSLNIAALDSMEDANVYVKKHSLEDKTILVISNSGKIMVMYGIYSSSVDAENDLSLLPTVISKNKPMILKIFRLQDSYNKNNLNDDSSIIEEIRIVEEQAAKEAQEKARLEELRIAEEKAVKEAQEKARLEELRIAEEQAAKEAQEKARLEEIRIAEEKAEKEAQEKARLEEIRIAEEKAEKEVQEKARLEELRIAEEQAAKEAQKKARLEEIRIAEEQAAKEAQEKARLEEIKIVEEKAAKEAQEKARLEELRIAEEQAAKEAQEKARLEELRIAEEQAVSEAQEKVRLEEIRIVEDEISNDEIQVFDTLDNFIDKFDDATNKSYTVKLSSIESNKVRWYIHRFGLNSNNIVIIENGNISDIYFGAFDSLEITQDAIGSLHPVISSNNPTIMTIEEVE
ncbi:TolC family protein [Poseidonibacter lekithochrous]|uniref:TolC family protein n=1 Tax=Poseidonibacter lekithochrous TaxID=1904463 RepID=UPI0008FCD6C8|nr:TolC family protein [Poseidonibacter lekithochrous]